MSLVSKRWHRTVYQTATLWHELVLTGDQLGSMSKQQRQSWVAAKRALLQRVGPLVRELTIAITDLQWSLLPNDGDEGGWYLASALGAVRPRLTKLRLLLEEEQTTLKAVGQLGRMPRLLELSIVSKFKAASSRQRRWTALRS
jgi:hypothetical protein